MYHIVGGNITSDQLFTLPLRAAQIADLAATLSDNGTFTVFAPTVAAIEAAGFDAATIDEAPTNKPYCCFSVLYKN